MILNDLLTIHPESFKYTMCIRQTIYLLLSFERGTMAKTDKWPDKDIGKPKPGRQIVKADLCLTALWVISIVVMTTGCMLIGQWTL